MISKVSFKQNVVSASVFYINKNKTHILNGLYEFP